MIRYYSTFYGTDSTEYTLKVYKDGFTGTPQEITLSGDPVTIEYTQEDIFKPTKLSGCTIKVLTPRILEDIYTGKVFDVRIEIYKEDDLIWTGFNSPNIYNSEWLTDYDQTEINGIDTISALQYIKYEKSQNGYQVRTFHDLLLEAIGKVNNTGSLIYMNSLQASLEDLRVNDRAFFDEDEEPITYLEIVEQICQFLGVTITQWKNDYYMLEVSKASQFGECDYITYSNNSSTTETKQENEITAVVGEANASISLGDTYNQINVLGNIIEMDEDTINLDSSDNEYLSLDGQTIENDIFDGNRAEDLNSRDADDLYKQYWCFNAKASRSDCVVSGTTTVINSANLLSDSLSSGDCFIERFAERDGLYSIRGLKEADADPIEFTNGIVFKIGNSHPVPGFVPIYKNQVKEWLKYKSGNEVFSMTSPNRLYSKNDVLILNLNLSYSNQLIKDLPINDSIVDKTIGLISGFKEVKYYDAEIENCQSETYNTPFILKCTLKIGNYYYIDDGTTTPYWSTSFGYMMVDGALVSKYGKLSGNHTVYNDVDFRYNIGDGAKGKLILFPSNLFGELEFKIYDVMAKPYTKNELEALTDGVSLSYEESQIWRKDGTDEEPYEVPLKYCHIDSINIKHFISPANAFDSIVDTKANNEDLLYNAEIDLDNVTEFNDVTLYLCTYNPDLCNLLSYSYVLDSNLDYVSTILKDGYELRPEEHIVQMYLNHYKDPKIIYSNILKNHGYKPISGVWVESLGRTLAVGSISYNLQFNTVDIKAYEL